VKPPFGQARCLLLIAVAALWIAADAAPMSAASPTCYDICGETTSCSATCENPDTNSSTTCGNFNGGGGAGMCVGYCGDGYCNSSNNETQASCPQDCTPVCVPNWVTTAEALVYSYQKNWFVYCELWSEYLVEQHDVACGQGGRDICDPRLVGRGYGVGVDCCDGVPTCAWVQYCPY